MQNLEGKVALITGGNKGIGYGIAEKLITQGMNVCITSRTQENATKAAEALNDIGGGKALGIVCDVRKMEDQIGVVSKTLDAFGKIDALIANAGVGYFANIEEMEIEKWHEVIDTNLTGVFYSIKAALHALKETKGYIFTISSLAGTNFFPTASAYNASKFGLTGFTQAVMLDVRNHGIKTSTIMPGSVATYFNGHTPSEKDAWKIQPSDIGQITLDLLKMDSRTLPSKVEVRPTMPPGK